MASPNGRQTVTVTTGPHLAADGTPIVGATVVLTPEWPLIHEASGTQIRATPVRLTTDALGVAQATIVASDAAGLRRTNFTWLVDYNFGYSGPALAAFRTFLPAATPVVDLELISASDPSGALPVVMPGVTSVAGFTGAVTGADIAADPAVRVAFETWLAEVGGGGSGLTTEQVQDLVAAMVRPGTGVTGWVYDDAAATLTLNVAAGGGSTDPEVVRDTIAAALIGSNISVAANDAGDTITLRPPGRATPPRARGASPQTPPATSRPVEPPARSGTPPSTPATPTE